MIRRRRAATRYANRTVAGRALADVLVAEAVVEKPVVLALPRGGVPVAAEVAAPAERSTRGDLGTQDRRAGTQRARHGSLGHGRWGDLRIPQR